MKEGAESRRMEQSAILMMRSRRAYIRYVIAPCGYNRAVLYVNSYILRVEDDRDTTRREIRCLGCERLNLIVLDFA